MTYIPNYMVIALEAVTNEEKWRGLIMSLMTFIMLILLVILAEKMIGRFLGIKKEDVSETSGKRMDQWGRTIIMGLFLFSFIFALSKENDTILKWNWIFFLTALMGLQTILEWKYLKDSKQYLLTLISSIIIICIFVYYVNSISYL